jgi:hypothetical protein
MARLTCVTSLDSNSLFDDDDSRCFVDTPPAPGCHSGYGMPWGNSGCCLHPCYRNVRTKTLFYSNMQCSAVDLQSAPAPSHPLKYLSVS